MTVMRPCLACGQENTALAERCSRCEAELGAWAEAPPFGAARKGRAATQGRPALVALLLLAVACAVGWSVVRFVSASSRTDVGPTWFEPKTMAAWETDDLRAKGVPPGTVRALIETKTFQPRRVLVSTHAPEQDLTLVLRTAAAFLVEARRRGEATLTHVAVVRHGDDVIEIPLGEAARLADPATDVGEWLGRSVPGSVAGPAVTVEAAPPAHEAEAPRLTDRDAIRDLGYRRPQVKVTVGSSPPTYRKG